MEKLIIHTYHVGGMSCSSCAATVKNNLLLVQGVTSVNVSLDKKLAEVSSTREIEKEALQEAMSKTHYTIDEVEA